MSIKDFKKGDIVLVTNIYAPDRLLGLREGIIGVVEEADIADSENGHFLVYFKKSLLIKKIDRSYACVVDVTEDSIGVFMSPTQLKIIGKAETEEMTGMAIDLLKAVQDYYLIVREREREKEALPKFKVEDKIKVREDFYLRNYAALGSRNNNRGVIKTVEKEEKNGKVTFFYGVSFNKLHFSKANKEFFKFKDGELLYLLEEREIEK